MGIELGKDMGGGDTRGLHEIGCDGRFCRRERSRACRRVVVVEPAKRQAVFVAPGRKGACGTRLKNACSSTQSASRASKAPAIMMGSS